MRILLYLMQQPVRMLWNRQDSLRNVLILTGVILTKMDGSAKGGIAIAIQAELGIPVKYIGVGEQIDDLQRFDSKEFVEALFNRIKRKCGQK